MKPWRKACEAALREVSRADALRIWRVGHEIDGKQHPIFDYRHEHTLAVVQAARWLAEQVGADAEVVEAAAWLHDSRKLLKGGKAKDHHAKEGAAAAAKVLAKTDFPPNKIPAVQHAILHHVGLRLSKPLEPLETACLWDADKLSKLGAASLIHFGGISGAFQPMTTLEILRRGEAWIPLAQGIVASMNTPPARREAERRLAFTIRHYAQLRREICPPMQECEP